MKTTTKTLLFLALSAIFFSCNSGGGALTNVDEENPNIDSNKPDKNISMKDSELLSSDVLAGSFIIQKDVFQAIYSSQNYGTFYQIYCKPYIAENNETLDFLEFKIVNYKGPLNIGFSPNANKKIEYKYAKGKLGLKLVVKGNGSVESVTIDVKDQNIKKGEFKALNIFRILERMYDGKSLSEKGIFDSEFYTRSGGLKPKRKRS